MKKLKEAPGLIKTREQEMRKAKIIGAAIVLAAYVLALPDIYGEANPLGWEAPRIVVIPAGMIVMAVAGPALLAWIIVGMAIFGFNADLGEFMRMKTSTLPAAVVFLMTLAGWFIWERILVSGRKRVEWNQSLVIPSLWLNSDGDTRCGPRPLDPSMSVRACGMQAI